MKGPGGTPQPLSYQEQEHVKDWFDGMGRPCGAGFFVRLLFLVRSLLRAAVCGTGTMLPALRTCVLPGTGRLCTTALCCPGGLCPGPRGGHLATILPDARVLSLTA